jgi:hypothetical protein
LRKEELVAGRHGGGIVVAMVRIIINNKVLFYFEWT